MSQSVVSAKLVVGAMVQIPRVLLQPHILAGIQSDLTLEPRVSEKYGFGRGEDAVISLWKDEGDYIAVPRQYAAERLGFLLDEHGFVDETSKGFAVDFRWVGDAEHDQRAAAMGKPDWSVKQRDWVQKVYDALARARIKGVIGEAPTSFGKTVCTMKLIGMLGRTTLVIVHKDFQLMQWAKAAKTWLGLTDEEIGLVRGPKCEFVGKSLVLAMVESLASRRDYPEEFYRYFGVVVGDEVHRLGAPEWSRAMPMFPAEIRFGVSATPRRKDGLDKAFWWSIGPVAARETEWYVKPTVYQVGWPVWIEPRKYAIVRTNPATGEERVLKVILPKLVNILVGLDKYNVWLVQEIQKAAEKGRTILVLSDRREHLTLLKELFDDVTKGMFNTGFYWGTTKKSDQATAHEKDVLFGTFGKAKEALDIQALDTLFLTTPRADVEQDVGRILRLDEDKKPPIVVDVVHVGVPTTEDFARKRLWLYKSKGFEVNKVGKW